MRAFCTIITSNYFPYASALYQSLIQIKEDETLIVLLCDDGTPNTASIFCPGITLLRLKDIYIYKEASVLYDKYSQQNFDAFRWSMKPVLLRYLLENGYEKVIYVDCDICFFNDYNFLFDQLDNFSVLLTPCWRTIEPDQHEEEFIDLFTDGLYNAGFIGANSKGIPALEWWTRACLFKIEINYEEGLFVDQKYLDAMPMMFENIGIIKHKGCNVAFWNQYICKRIYSNGMLLINGKEPIVFIHFSNKYIKELLSGEDQLIFSYFKWYEEIFMRSGFQLSHFIDGLPEYKKPNSLQLMKRKLLLRTRFKLFMHKLIDRI